MTAAGFPHSDTLGSQLVCQLPEAYRRLQRPSSAPSAKASTVCPYKLHALQKLFRRNQATKHKVFGTWKHLKEDARVHCTVLKQPTNPSTEAPTHTPRAPPPQEDEPETMPAVRTRPDDTH